MSKIKREFFLNAFVISPIAVLICGYFAARISVSHSELLNTGDWFLPFIISFLVSYPSYLLISFINYVIGRKLKKLGKRLILFNALGVLVVFIGWLLFDEMIALIIFLTPFILFSIVSVIMNQTNN
ncbi:hypothetical protein [Bacillus horti]|uniref:Uncharacterized protein n=1 Tax=Caldalkalibacillus horti TaxID=77523 RepID=A0ABT9VVD2_9BACI|nr:hypothetical protein [Bacillus horti]MDQ0164941.1 hypothetical protein [Bacillus horti]